MATCMRLKKMGPKIDYIYCGGYGVEYEVRG